MSAGRDVGTPGRRPSNPRRAPFALVVVALFGLGLVGQLLLNTALQHGSFDMYSLGVEASALEERRQALDQQVAQQEEPGTLAELANGLGMVPSENPVFLRLADGGIAGTPIAATAPPPPPPPPAPSPPAPLPPAPGTTAAPPAAPPAATAPAPPVAPMVPPPATSTTP